MSLELVLGKGVCESLTWIEFIALVFNHLPERVRVWEIKQKLERTSRALWFWVTVLVTSDPLWLLPRGQPLPGHTGSPGPCVVSATGRLSQGQRHTGFLPGFG